MSFELTHNRLGPFRTLQLPLQRSNTNILCSSQTVLNPTEQADCLDRASVLRREPRHVYLLRHRIWPGFRSVPRASWAPLSPHPEGLWLPRCSLTEVTAQLGTLDPKVQRRVDRTTHASHELLKLPPAFSTARSTFGSLLTRRCALTVCAGASISLLRCAS